MLDRTIESVASERARLWEAGFRPIPVYNHTAPVGSPGKQPAGKGWQTDARRDPPVGATMMPSADALNTGILCDGLRAIDIDIDDTELAEAVRSCAYERFAEAPRRWRLGSGRCLLLYRAAAGEPPKRVLGGSLGKVEVLGKGQQFVACGVHPCGDTYEWHPERPGEDAFFDTLPMLTESEIDDFFFEIAGLLGASHTVKVDAETAQHETSLLGAEADIADVRRALEALPNDDAPDWEHWNRLGMATWRATGGSEMGYAAWNAWSARHPAYDPAATRQRWDHYAASPPTNIGAGTLFHLYEAAIRNGTAVSAIADQRAKQPTTLGAPAMRLLVPGITDRRNMA